MMTDKSNKSLTDGYNAIFRGAYEGGASHFVFGFMPYAHREIPDIADVEVTKILDEKIALSYAFGLALSGKRTVCMLSAIPFDLASTYGYTGINGALVILYLEDNEHIEYDSRSFWAACNYPVFEPSDPSEIKRFIKISFNFSEKYDIPVVIRVNRRILDSFCYIEICEPKVIKDRPYRRDPSKYVLLPSTVKLCKEDIDVRRHRIQEDVEGFPVNNVSDLSSDIGIIASGTVARSVKECMDDVALFSLGISYPLPIVKLKEFASKHSKLFVIEEHPFIELELKKNGIDCLGESLFPSSGPRTVREIAATLLKRTFTEESNKYTRRSPDLCYDCGLMSVFSKVKEFGYPVFTDNGCGVLGGAFLGATELGVKYSLPTALAFGKKGMCICVLTYKELCQQYHVLNNFELSNVALVIPLTSRDIENFAPLINGIQAISIRDFNRLDDIKSGVYLVILDRVCKYEN